MSRNPGGLAVPSNIGVGSQELQVILSRFQTLGGVESDLQHQGISMALDPPQFPLPRITAEILSNINTSDYTRVYSEVLAWFNFITPLHAQVRAALVESENKLSIVEETMRKRLRQQNRLVSKEARQPNDEITSEVITDPTYQNILLEVQVQKQRKLELEAYVEICERNMRVISRQVEIKKIEMGGNDREGNLNRGPRAPQRYLPVR